MYSDFINQTIHFSKYMLAFLFLFILLPSILSGRIDEDKVDNYAANYIRSVFFIIGSGYILVAVKIYEFITLLVIILLLYYRKIASEAKLQGNSAKEGTGLFLLRVLDRQVHILKTAMLRCKNAIASHMRPSGWHLTLDNVLFTVFTIIVLLVSAYVRFYDAFTHAAMPLSDSYITLDWLKAVDHRRLFYEPGGGVYPRGLSIIMATIHKFTFMDSLYVLKYTGPLNGLLIVVSILYVVYKLTKSKYAALVISAFYGIGAGLLGSEFERQAATNSQELALVFFLPTMYFAYKYVKERRQRDCITTIVGLTVMGLIHTFVYFFGVISVGMNIFILFVTGPVKNYKCYIKLVIGGILSAVISIIPFTAGLLEGIGLHGSSVEFLTDTGDILLKKLSPVDNLAVIAVILFGLFLLFMAKKKTTEFISLIPVFLTVMSIFLIYYVGGYVTKSTLLDTRTQEIWALCAALAIGLGTGTLFSRLEAKKTLCFIPIGLCMISIAYMGKQIGIKPLEPYKMEWDSGVEQYLKISQEYYDYSWTLVAEERQYAMVNGTGFLVTTADFTSTYSAKNPFTGNWKDIGEHIFLYQQKNIFKVKETNSVYAIEEPKYEKMKTDGETLVNWLTAYTASGGRYQIYYEDQNIRIIYIHNKAYEDVDQGKLWGGNY
jgi:hypothetical protein